MDVLIEALGKDKMSLIMKEKLTQIPGFKSRPLEVIQTSLPSLILSSLLTRFMVLPLVCPRHLLPMEICMVSLKINLRVLLRDLRMLVRLCKRICNRDMEVGVAEVGANNLMASNPMDNSLMVVNSLMVASKAMAVSRDMVAHNLIVAHNLMVARNLMVAHNLIVANNLMVVSNLMVVNKAMVVNRDMVANNLMGVNRVMVANNLMVVNRDMVASKEIVLSRSMVASQEDMGDNRTMVSKIMVNRTTVNSLMANIVMTITIWAVTSMVNNMLMIWVASLTTGVASKHTWVPKLVTFITPIWEVKVWEVKVWVCPRINCILNPVIWQLMTYKVGMEATLKKLATKDIYKNFMI